MSPGKESVPAYAGPEPPLVLFLCRNNAGASILAEAILRHLARGRVRAASAADRKATQVNRYALECLTAHRVATAGLSSKPWGELFGVDRPPVRVLITLGDPNSYAAQANWVHGTVRTVKAHWSTPHPEDVVGSDTEIRLAFEEVYVTLEARIRQFLALPLHRLSDEAVSRELVRIAEVPGELS